MSEHIVRQTRQKDAIRDVLNGCDEFISAQELHRMGIWDAIEASGHSAPIKAVHG